MKNNIDEFYSENRSLIEISSILLVASGLFLNINSTNDWVQRSLDQIKFFLILFAIISFVHLIYKAIDHFLNPFLNMPTNKDVGEQINQLTFKVIIVTLCLLLGLIFTVNLATYFIISYKWQTSFLAITTISFAVFYKFNKLILRFNVYFFIASSILFIFIIPLASYLYLYFHLYQNYSNILKIVNWL